MRYLSLGDTADISASCHYLDFGGTGIVLDAGMDPNEDGYAAVPPFEMLRDQELDHVVITHAHTTTSARCRCWSRRSRT